MTTTPTVGACPNPEECTRKDCYKLRLHKAKKELEQSATPTESWEKEFKDKVEGNGWLEYEGDYETIKSFIRTQISLAEQRGREEAVEYILEHGKLRVTPNNDEDTVKAFLLKRFADKNYRMATLDLLEQARQGTSTSSPE